MKTALAIESTECPPNLVEALANDEQLVALPGLVEMAPGEAHLRQSMCESKARYDKRGARTMLNCFAKNRGRHGRPDSLRIYPCPFCAGWHLTKDSNFGF